MAETSIRPLVKARLLELFRARPELTDVQVEGGDMGDLTEQDAVWCAAVHGAGNHIPVMQGGRKQRSDSFDLKWVVQCGSHGDDAATSEAQATTYLDAIDGTLADDPSLGNLDGLWQGAVISNVDGPDTWRTPEGSVSFYTVTISCTARYS